MSNSDGWEQEVLDRIALAVMTPEQQAQYRKDRDERQEFLDSIFRFASREIDQYVDDGPTIVCLCGSTRFSEAFQQANLAETLAGKIVLSIGCDMRSDTDLFAGMSDDERAEVKQKLDELHLRKIDLAQEVLILNVGGYIGESTQRELEYAIRHHKEVRFLEPAAPK